MVPRKIERNHELPELDFQLQDYPDSRNLEGLCPRCGKFSAFTVVGDLPFTYEQIPMPGNSSLEKPTDRVCSLRCRSCHQGLLVVEERVLEDGGSPGWGRVPSWRAVFWWPQPATAVPDGVPEAIAAVYREAELAICFRCQRGALLLLRLTLESITTEKGHVEGGLSERLAGLCEAQKMHPAMLEWAKDESLTGLGGCMLAERRVTPTDARNAMAFVTELMRFVYELPAWLERARKDSKDG